VTPKEEMEHIWVHYPLAFPNHRAGWMLRSDLRIIEGRVGYYLIDLNLVLVEGRRLPTWRRKSWRRKHALHSR
jgi:hypothetical protein